MKIIAIIVAAGRGSRVKSDIPKQYFSLKDKTILYHAILPFINHPRISNIICSIAPSDLDLYNDAISNLQILEPVFGGVERQDSVRIALEKIKDLNPDYVLIHDGARPFITTKIIDDLIVKLQQEKAAIPAIAIADSVKKIENNKIIKTISRDNLFLAQTPQAFDYKLILDLHNKYKNQKFTDDASICEKEGIDVTIIDGNINNFKITTKEDYERAKKSC